MNISKMPVAAIEQEIKRLQNESGRLEKVLKVLRWYQTTPSIRKTPKQPRRQHRRLSKAGRPRLPDDTFVKSILSKGEEPVPSSLINHKWSMSGRKGNAGQVLFRLFRKGILIRKTAGNSRRDGFLYSINK